MRVCCLCIFGGGKALLIGSSSASAVFTFGLGEAAIIKELGGFGATFCLTCQIILRLRGVWGGGFEETENAGSLSFSLIRRSGAA